MMHRVQIGQVAIGEAGRLFVTPVVPPGQVFEHIYRAAQGISWDATSRSFFAPTPGEWSHADWFKQIVTAVAEEYGLTLVLQPTTRWSNVPPHVRSEVEAWVRGGPTSG